MDMLPQSVAPYWIWLALSCLLLAAEVFAPSGLLLCLGSSAAVVAALVFFFSGLSWLWTLVVFALLTVASGLLWWKILRGRRLREQDAVAQPLNLKARQLTGYRAVLTDGIKAGRGRMRIHDSDWPVRAEADYPAGTLVEVTAMDGIELLVRKLD